MNFLFLSHQQVLVNIKILAQQVLWAPRRGWESWKMWTLAPCPAAVGMWAMVFFRLIPWFKRYIMIGILWYAIHNIIYVYVYYIYIHQLLYPVLGGCLSIHFYTPVWDGRPCHISYKKYWPWHTWMVDDASRQSLQWPLKWTVS